MTVDPLAAIWIVSTFLSASAVGCMGVLITLRHWRDRKDAERSRTKARLRKLLVDISSGGSGELSLKIASHRHKRLLIESASEILDLLRGESAARVVNALKSCGVKDVLLQQLLDGKVADRASAAECLTYFSDSPSRDAMIAALRDTSIEVRLAAASGLIQRRCAPPVPELIAALSEHRPSARLGQVISALFEHYQDHVLSVAMDAKQRVYIRTKAIDALSSKNNMAFLPYLVALSSGVHPDIRAAAVRGLGRLAHTDAAEAIARRLTDEAWFVRAAAADAAGKSGYYELAPLLADLSQDPVWWVRVRSSEAVLELDRVGRQALRKLAASHILNRDNDARVVPLRASSA